MRELTIDPEFDRLCPKLTAEEFGILQADISANGCRDKIVVWANHDDTIIDGHHRYRICRAVDRTFQAVALKFDTREEVKEWIIKTAMGRRNLTEEQKSYLRGLRYENDKKKHGGDRKSKGNDCPLNSTDKKLADEYDVAPRTIKNDAKFATAVNVIDEASPGAKDAILSGKLGATKKDVVKLATLPKAAQRRAMKSGADGVKQAVKEADVSKATAGLPDSKTPHQEANESAARRWHQSFTKLYQLLTSIRDVGGVLKLTRKWPADARADSAAELKRIRSEIDDWIEALEA